MIRTKKLLLTAILSVVMALALIFGITLSLPVQQASAADGTFGSGFAYTNQTLGSVGYAATTLETVDAATVGYDGSGTVLKMSSTTTDGGTGVTLNFSEEGYTRATVESINFKVRFDYTSTPTSSEFRLSNGSSWLFSGLIYVTDYASGTWNTITIDANHTAWANMFDNYGTLKDVNVCTRIKTSTITWYLADIEIAEKEETVVDITETVSIQTKAAYGDYQEAYMIRIQIPTDTSWGSGKCLNDSYPNMLKYLTINGKTIYDLRAEYAAALAAGTAKQITWTGYPNNTGSPSPMQPNIADDVTRDEPRALYAPIFAMLTYHGSLSANCIDIYIPGTYLDPSEIETFGITEDFSWIAEDGTVYKTSDSVTFYGLGYKQAYKQIGELNLTETETTVTAVQPNASNTNFLLIYLSENNYDGLSHEKGNLQGNSVAMENMAKLKLWNYIEVDGKPMTSVYRDNNVSEIYYQVWSKADSFAFRVTTLPTDGTGAVSKITIKAGAQFPKYSGDTATLVSATECYTVKKEMVFVNENGTWVEYTEKIETNVTMAQMLYDTPTDAFAGIMLEGSDYASAPNTYAGDVVTALSYAQSENFLSHILIDDVPLIKPDEAFLNVWGNYGYFNFRANSVNATKITILAGCEFPTYKALSEGANEVYVTKSDVTFVKGGDGTWVEGSLPAGEYDTNVNRLVYARNNKDNWMMFTLSNKDYPNAGETYNVGTTEAQISALNLYDKIVVDGYTLRSRINTHGTPAEAPQINLWVADCFAIRIAGCAGALDGAQKVTIRAGAQFPSYAYITGGVEAYYVTTEEVTFVNVGADNGAWERQYTATFVADGEVVETISYLISEGFTAPEVPEKEGYKGAWESYTANGNITVEAVYTERTFAYENTNISAVKDQDGFLILTLTNDDYSSAPATWWGPNGTAAKEVLNAMKAVDFSIYVGDTEIALGDDAIINVWGGMGNDLAFYLVGYSSTNMPTTVTLKKGCQFPSYAYVNDGTMLCYELVEDVTFNKIDGVWVRENELVEDDSVQLPTEFDDNYILSDLYQVGYGSTSVFQDGIETLVRTDGSEADYHYGRIDSKSFTLSFDFTYNQATWYESFAIMFGTEGYNSVKACFGWRFFLLRGSDTDGISNSQCVQFFSGCDKGLDTYGNFDAPSINGVYFVAEQTYHVTIGYKLIDADTVLTYVSIDGNELANKQYDLVNAHDEYGNFSSYSSYMNTITFCKEQAGGQVIISDPDMDMTTAKNTLILNDGSAIPQEIVTDSYVLPALNPAEYNKGGSVFVGWTTSTETYPNLYPAGYEISLEAGSVTLYSVWINFTMQNGAAVRKASPSGIRFLVDIDKPYYEAGAQLGYFTELGTILAPTSYLTNRALTHELGAGYFVVAKTTEWNDDNTYSAAFVNLSADQYARMFSARGYIQVQYTTGVGYIYTAYDANEHARSMYQVATAAINSNEIAKSSDYVQKVADITINGSLEASKNAEAQGDYGVSSSISNSTLTVNVTDGSVKAVLINGVRVIMGHNAEIAIDNVIYNVTGFKLSSDGKECTFTLEIDAANSLKKIKAQHLAVINGYLNSDAYTPEHKAYIVNYINEGGIITTINNSESVSEYIDSYNEVVGEVSLIKTAEELAANDTGTETLAAPVLTRGLGYTVTWSEVNNVDYYCVYDSNDYREYTVVMANEERSYKAEVVGNHNITVTAHSFYEDFNSATSNEMTTPEVKPVFTYKSMLDGLYKFSSSQMSTMGISTTGCYYDSSDEKYFVYYNKDTGWSPNGAMATDWTSPAEFPAHAQRLKDMGNNIILVAYDTNASYKAGDTWEASRLRYVMDTAWSMGMKVLVCDEVFYDLSMSDGSDGAASGDNGKAQVTAAINARDGFAEYVTHPAFYGFSLDDEPYNKYISALSNTISALDEACKGLGVSDPFYLACLFQYEGGKLAVERYDDKEELKTYYENWLNIEGVDNQYLYVDIYTQHAMGQPTNRYNNSFDVVYGDSYLGGKYKFYQALTAHTQNTDYVVTEKKGELLEQDLYMSLLYAAAHDVAGYSWFCYFPITGELSGSMCGYDGNGYGNGEQYGNKASGCYYNAAKQAGYQFELIQGVLDGYEWKTRSVSGDLLTTTLSNGTNTATMYVNAAVDDMSGEVTVMAKGSQCYLVGYGLNGADYVVKTAGESVTLQPGQALLCIE